MFSVIFNRLRMFCTYRIPNLGIDEEDKKRKEEENLTLNHLYEILYGYYFFMEPYSINNIKKPEVVIMNNRKFEDIYVNSQYALRKILSKDDYFKLYTQCI